MVVILRFLLLALIAGWIVGRASRGRGYGIFGNLALGAVGSLVGDFVFGFVGLPLSSLLGSLTSAVVGSTTVLWLISFVKPVPTAKEEA